MSESNGSNKQSASGRRPRRATSRTTSPRTSSAETLPPPTAPSTISAASSGATTEALAENEALLVEAEAEFAGAIYDRILGGGVGSLTADEADFAQRGGLHLVRPRESGSGSTAKDVSAKIQGLLEALASLEWVADGRLVVHLREYLHRILAALRAEGWRIGIEAGRLSVEPPECYGQRRG